MRLATITPKPIEEIETEEEVEVVVDTTSTPTPEENEEELLNEDSEEEVEKESNLNPPQGPPSYIKEKEKDVAFFRFGYLEYMKLNTESMVRKFTEGVWYTVDLKIDWDN